MIDFKGFVLFKRRGCRTTLVSYHRRDSLTWRFALDLFCGSDRYSFHATKIFAHYKTHQDKCNNWVLKLPFKWHLAYHSQTNMARNNTWQ